MTQGSTEHWDRVYGSTAVDAVSWFQARPDTSLRLIADVCELGDAVIDVGAGASTLAEDLLGRGWTDVTVLDVSAEALALVRRRLGTTTLPVQVVVADLLTWRPTRRYAAWHDRAVFHFLTTAEDQLRYADTAARAVRPGGHLVVGTFAEDGPTRCSGLATGRYSADALAEKFEPTFTLEHSEREVHHTPGGTAQPFTWVVLRRT